MALSRFLLISCFAFLAAGAALAAGNAAKGKEVYMITCIACHNLEPAQDGPIGPAIKGASRALLEARVMKAAYPAGYKPKRATKIMPPYPHLAPNLDDLAAFLK